MLLCLTFSSKTFAYSVIPCGEAIGVIVQTKGVLVTGTAKVIDENGNSTNPAKKAGIIKGDRIVSVNNLQINTAEELARLISQSEGKIELTVMRNNRQKVLPITPVNTTTGLKLGMFVKDSTAGIGTITFIDPVTQIYSGLGHGICDPDTNTILPITGGSILKCELKAPTKGKPGLPGELNGEFIDKIEGTIQSNTQAGISGVLNKAPQATAVEVCPPEQVTTGDAYIFSQIDENGVGRFSIKILSIDPDDKNGKNMTVEITDEYLISKTGGIVQGMSGSPIIQNGRIIGAITHVFVNNPKKGYGIFINNMLQTTRADNN